MVSRRLLAFGLALMLSGCGPRANVDIVSSAPSVGTQIPILVGTTREAEAPGRYTTAGRGDLSYARYVVSIPPDHVPGEVELGGRTPDPTTAYVTRSVTPYADPRAFQSAVRQALRADPTTRGEAVLFIHGFNNTLGDGLYRMAQMKNDVGMSGVPLHFAWASAANPLGYVRDRDSALLARDDLIAMLDDMTSGGAREIVILAHSMGSFLLMETLVWLEKSNHPAKDRIAGVILLSPDLDVDLFRAQAREIGTLPKSFVIFTSARDRALRLSARLTGETNRLGTITGPEPVADLDVAVIDVTALDDVANSHLAAVSSPTMLTLLDQARAIDAAFSEDPSARIGLLPGTIVTVRNATAIAVSPVEALATALD